MEYSRLSAYALVEPPLDKMLYSRLSAYALIEPPLDKLIYSRLTAYALVEPLKAAAVGEKVVPEGMTWAANPSSFTYRWFRHSTVDDLTGVAISGATNGDYILVGDDANSWISCEITPINALGAGEPVRSNIIGPVEAP